MVTTKKVRRVWLQDSILLGEGQLSSLCPADHVALLWEA